MRIVSRSESIKLRRYLGKAHIYYTRDMYIDMARYATQNSLV